MQAKAFAASWSIEIELGGRDGVSEWYARPILCVADINKGFELMHAGQSIRSVVIY